MNLRPSPEDRIRSLELELEAQKQRFIDATKRSTDQFERVFFLESWVRKNPLHSAILLAVGGFALASTLLAQRTVQQSEIR